MMPAWRFGSRYRVRLILVGVLFLLAFWFLHGSSGLVSIMIKNARCQRISRQNEALRKEIAARSRLRAKLANPDTAKALAWRLFAPDSLLNRPGR